MRPKFCLHYRSPYEFGDGSYAAGVGGSEAAFLQLVRALGRAGHEVEVFARPPVGAPGGWGHADRFDPRVPRDVFVLMRHDPAFLAEVRARIKVYWTTHEAPRPDEVAAADRVVVASPHQRDSLVFQCGIDPAKVVVIPYGIDPAEYADRPPKVPGKVIYCSVPDRGLEHLAAIFPRIRRRVPGAELHVTSDFRLWGGAAGDAPYRAILAGQPGVHYHGRLGRADLVRHQATAEAMAYPCHFREFFCISALECMAAGCVPVTTALGALPTTVGDRGVLLGMDPGWQGAFADATADLLLDDERRGRLAAAGRAHALGPLSWDRIVTDHWLPMLRGLGHPHACG